jgi:SH3 domain-containing YSC84-like protein 1
MKAWSAPSAIGTAGMGIGSQAGAELTEFLFVLSESPPPAADMPFSQSAIDSKSAVRSFMSAGSVTLGGNLSFAVGPVGRTGEASGSINSGGRVAAM